MKSSAGASADVARPGAAADMAKPDTAADMMRHGAVADMKVSAADTEVSAADGVEISTEAFLPSTDIETGLWSAEDRESLRTPQT